MTTTSSTGTWRLKMSSTPPHTASKWATLVSALNANQPTFSPPSAALRPTRPLNSFETKVTSDHWWIFGLWAFCYTSWWRPRFLSMPLAWEDCASVSSGAPSPFPLTSLTSASMLSRARWGLSPATAFPCRRSCPALGWGELSTLSHTHLLCPHLRTWLTPHGHFLVMSTRSSSRSRTWASLKLTWGTTWWWTAVARWQGFTGYFCTETRGADPENPRDTQRSVPPTPASAGDAGLTLRPSTGKKSSPRYVPSYRQHKETDREIWLLGWVIFCSCLKFMSYLMC